MSVLITLQCLVITLEETNTLDKKKCKGRNKTPLGSTTLQWPYTYGVIIQLKQTWNLCDCDCNKITCVLLDKLATLYGRMTVQSQCEGF